jgi:hypothetical protein
LHPERSKYSAWPQGNEKRDLVCDPMTYAVGSGLATIGKAQCPTLRK